MIFTIDRVYRHKDRLLFRNVLLPSTIEQKLFRMGGEEAAGRAGRAGNSLSSGFLTDVTPILLCYNFYFKSMD